ncbi:MAG: hypothetical protein GXP55_07790 [Deltaproteobacteria bacterium]|nr:hypothetical protein [Deltaproteobacteria bacterium]
MRLPGLLLVLLGSTPLALGCLPSLGAPDSEAARVVVFVADGPLAGQPAFAGQALMRSSCGDARFCHSPDADNSAGDARFGTPAGLNFDVSPACAQGESCDAQVERLKVNQRRTYRWREAIYQQVDEGYMPPGRVGSEIVASSTSYSYADGTPVPGLDTPEGKQILRTWLGAGSPVVERFAPAVASVPAGADCADGTIGDCKYGLATGPAPVVEATWTSIYTQIIHPLCGVRCHGTSAPDYRSTTRLDLSTQRIAYDQMVGVAATGNTCAGAGSHVLPGDSGNSLLVNLMGSSPRCGVRMPQGGPFLTDTQLAVVAEWIDAGALDN